VDGQGFALPPFMIKKNKIALLLFLFSCSSQANISLDLILKPLLSNHKTKNEITIKAHQNCKRKVLVAVIDTGIDIHHPDLKSSIWMNDGESGMDSQGRDKATNGVDDDGNGYIDDVHGWNFAGQFADVSDSHGHGTHIAGIIAGLSQSSDKSIPNCAVIMPIKYIDPDTTTKNSILNTSLSILYAIKMGAEIINYSGGGLSSNEFEKRSVQLSNYNQILFIAASGNEANNADEKPFFPASYQTPNMISVGAVDRRGNILENSNFGERSVDVAAPGLFIFSTLPKGKYGLMSGTSQATAFVTRAAVSVLNTQKIHSMKSWQLKQTVLSNVIVNPSLKGKIRSAGIISTDLTQFEPQIRRLGQSSFSRN
jgi:thermitase